MAGNQDPVPLTAVFKISIAFDVWRKLGAILIEEPVAHSIAWEQVAQEFVAEIVQEDMFISLAVYYSIYEAGPSTLCPVQTSLDPSSKGLHLLLSTLDAIVEVANYLGAVLQSLPQALAGSAPGLVRTAMSRVMQQSTNVPSCSSPMPPRASSKSFALQASLLLLKLAQVNSSISKQTRSTQAALCVL